MSMVAALALAGVLTQSPEEMLRRSDVGTFAPSSFRARLVLKNLPQGASHEVEVWRSGEAKTLIRFLDPRERGKYLLRLEGQIWLLSPSAKKPVHLSPSYRLYGGATLDEVLGIRLARAYQVESASRRKDPGGTLVAFELRAKSEGMLFPYVHYVVRVATARPVSATYRLRSGRDATAVEFVQWNESGLVYARRVVVRDLLRKGVVTEVEVLELQERTIPDGLFALDDPAARRALETTTSKSP
jgi:Outer membrane lipoprotein-sorting protein